MIDIDHVSFPYSGAERENLPDFILQIPKGECAVLTGESGCGKTRVTRLIVPKAGSILLSGIVIGLIEFLIGAGWAVAVGFILGAIIAELLTRIGNYMSFWLNTIGYSVYMMFFALGTYLPMVITTGKALPESRHRLKDI